MAGVEISGVDVGEHRSPGEASVQSDRQYLIVHDPSAGTVQ